jgi:hypothetical protein
MELGEGGKVKENDQASTITSMKVAYIRICIERC